jgi:Fic family protein
MIYGIPTLRPIDREVIGMINEQRQQLEYRINRNPGRWTGFLRRNTFARALQGSNSIEGIDANLAEAVAIIDDEKPDTLQEETVRALQGYRTAMTYIMRTFDDPYCEINAQLIRSLHYILLSYDLTKLPGQWRTGQIFVIREENKERVYEGPDPDLVPDLMAELIAQISENDRTDSIVKAAMAHLNLTMIHPFKDGNGRMARALQTLVLSRDRILSPVFCSIEEWLGRNTTAYYEVLAQVGQGNWNPDHDARPWLRFCLVAHYQQAATLVKRNEEIGRVWDEIDTLSESLGLPDRMQTALVDAAFGYRVRNNKYRQDHELSEVVASRDLKRLCDLELLSPVGEKRGRYYLAAESIKVIREKSRDRSRAPDPYFLAQERTKVTPSTTRATRTVVPRTIVRPRR